MSMWLWEVDLISLIYTDFDYPVQIYFYMYLQISSGKITC